MCHGANKIQKDEYSKQTSMAKRRKASMAKRRVWSISGLLLVLVCRSVPQDPPRPIEDIVVVSVFLYSPSTALSQSAVAYVHVAPGRPISDRLLHRYHLFSVRQVINRSLYCHVTLRKYLLN